MRNRISSPGGSFSLALVLLLLTGRSVAQQTQWVNATPSVSPSARHFSAMAYDWIRQRVVLFGGRAVFASIQDTWEWDGKNWTQVNPTVSPSTRDGHSLVYDFRRQRAVLFGGSGVVGLLRDTWEWNGKNWTQRKPTASPGIRVWHAMAYDLARGRSVVFSGGNVRGGNDTWEWDGKNWAQALPNNSPSWRWSSAMAYDLIRQQTVIFGGVLISPPLIPSNDTWKWDGKLWTREFPSLSPPARSEHAMAYDTLQQRIVLFGGKDSLGKPLNDTFEWDGKTWARVKLANSPSKRMGHVMAYDVAREQVVLFGGRDSNGMLGDTWLYSLKKIPGKYTSFGTGCGSPAVTLSAAPASTPTIGKNFLLDSRNLPQASTMAIMAFGASRTKFGSITLPLNLSAFGMPGCFLNQSTELLVPYPVKNGSGQFSLPIPSNTRLIAATVFAQAMIVALSANSAGLLSSNGGAILIGNK